MSNKKRSSTRLIRLPIRFGDSIHEIRKKNTDRNKQNEDDLIRKGDDDQGKVIREIEEMVRVSGENSKGFVGDLNSNDFLKLQSQVNIPSSSIIYDDIDVSNKNVADNMMNVCDNVSEKYGNKGNTTRIIVAEKIDKDERDFNEAMYHLRMMWYKFGLGEIQMNDKGILLAKFSDERGMEEAKPKKLLVWARLINVPMEAWSVEGISALASSIIGKPIIMDGIVAKMCKTWEGRLGYARVLVELNAEKKVKDKIEIIYKRKDDVHSFSKIVDVMYAWKPPVCKHCRVFGHEENNCHEKVKVIPNEVKSKSNEQEDVEFRNVKYKKDINYRETIEGMYIVATMDIIRM
nr:hypothetical protein [Tanacetum cinerariifolium]